MNLSSITRNHIMKGCWWGLSSVRLNNVKEFSSPGNLKGVDLCSVRGMNSTEIKGPESFDD